MAVVLGTALSSFAPPAASAAGVRAISDISRYCTACWRNARLHPDAWSDCTQEVFCRLLDRVNPAEWGQVLTDEGQERRELIRAIDAVKKRNQRGRKMISGEADTFADRQEARQRRLAVDRSAVQEAGVRLLSQRQQQVVKLSLDGWSVHDIAAELRLPPERVSDEKYKAIQKLRAHFRSTD